MTEFSSTNEPGKRSPHAGKSTKAFTTPIKTAANRPPKSPDSTRKRARAPASLDNATIATINNALAELPNKLSSNWKQIAEQAGLPNGNSFYNHKSGRSRLLSLETYIRLSKAHHISIDEMLGLGSESRPGILRPTQALVVRSKAQRGVHQDTPDLPLDQQFHVALPISPEHRAAGAYGVQLFDDVAYDEHEGQSIFAVIPFRATRDRLAPGQSVIIHTRTGAGVEISIADVISEAEGLALELPAHSGVGGAPRRLRVRTDGHFVSTRGKNMTVEALVIGKWQKFPA